MITALNPRYRPPSRDDLSNNLIPAWYSVTKQNVIQQLAQVNKIAITCDGWTSVAQGPIPRNLLNIPRLSWENLARQSRNSQS